MSHRILVELFMSAGSEVLEDEDMFQGIMDDLATLHVLGVKLVILASVRFQVDRSCLLYTSPSPRDRG